MRALLVVPPFGGLDRPSLGVHVVQAVARQRGHSVDVFYSNIAFAAHIGEIAYMIITTFGTLELLGERIMGLPLGTQIPSGMMRSLNQEIERASAARGLECAGLTVKSIRAAIDGWLEDVVRAVSPQAYDVIGFSSTFEQINGVAVLARACRRAMPSARLVVGGANCDGEMAPAMKRFVPEIDMVFSGESEAAFADYLSDPAMFGASVIVSSRPNEDLNALPPPDYAEFFGQFEKWLPESILRQSGDLKISYETSRGCWWGQKHHCTFCGLNGGGMSYREKRPEKVVAELAALAASTGVRKIEMTDNIMPHSYFGTLVPILAEADLGLEIFYEQKANISLDKVLALQAAGVVRIQPGIEALQDDLLRLMKKGTSRKQNIALLRYSRSVGLQVDWNLLSGFPNDRESWYDEVLQIAPLLAHLQPPTGLYALNFDRFSPYFENPAQYGIETLLPAPAYTEAFPGCDYAADLAYHFQSPSAGMTPGNSDVVRRLADAVGQWRERWERSDGAPPCLEVVEIAEGSYALVDTRGLPGTSLMRQISIEQASVALSFHHADTAATRWGIAHGVCVRGRDGYVPLACAVPRVLRYFESIWAPDLEDAPV
jgi:ribosomal peptide maturation radical SAM protein 1